jgi:hypothetical protein
MSGKTVITAIVTMAAVIALAVVILFFMLPTGMSLTISDKAGHVYLEEAVTPGDIVSLEFTHSVEKVEVVDTFIIAADGTLMLSNTTYGSLGWGLPSDESYNITVENGNFTIKNINETLEGINFITWANSHEYLAINGKNYPIFSIVPKEKPLFLSVEHNTPAIMLFHKLRTYI